MPSVHRFGSCEAFAALKSRIDRPILLRDSFHVGRYAGFKRLAIQAGGHARVNEQAPEHPGNSVGRGDDGGNLPLAPGGIVQPAPAFGLQVLGRSGISERGTENTHGGGHL